MKEIRISQSITPRESKALNRYLTDIASTRPVSPEREVELATRIQQGDLKARNELVTANLRFVISVAKQYQGFGVPLADLINEGNLGLIRAAERFDPTRGFKFDSCAVWWIRQAILSFLEDKSRAVRLPQNVLNVLARLRAASNAFEQENYRTPSIDELAELVDMTPEKVASCLSHVSSTTSLDSPLSTDSDTTFGETLPDSSVEETDAPLIAESLKHDLHVALNAIPLREQKIIRLYYGLDDNEPRSIDVIAQEVRLSGERVRQLIEKSVSTIRRLYGTSLGKYA